MVDEMGRSRGTTVDGVGALLPRYSIGIAVDVYDKARDDQKLSQGYDKSQPIQSARIRLASALLNREDIGIRTLELTRAYDMAGVEKGKAAACVEKDSKGIRETITAIGFDVPEAPDAKITASAAEHRGGGVAGTPDQLRPSL